MCLFVKTREEREEDDEDEDKDKYLAAAAAEHLIALNCQHRTFSVWRRQAGHTPPRVPPWPTVTNFSLSRHTDTFSSLMSWAHFSGADDGGGGGGGHISALHSSVIRALN